MGEPDEVFRNKGLQERNYLYNVESVAIINKHQSLFAPTGWSAVLTAKDKPRPTYPRHWKHFVALTWHPVYAFIRPRGRSAHDAQDLVQEFFAKLIQKDCLRAAAPEKGKFRTFLRVCLKRFLSNELERSKTFKRGGGRFPISLEQLNAEEHCELGRANSASTDRLIDCASAAGR